VPLGDSDKDALEFQPGDAVSIFVIVSSADGGRKVTANLKGPVVVNNRNRMAKQVVIYNPAYSVRQSWLGPPVESMSTPGAIVLDRASARG
jgi:flagellar assembly factor FliW